MYLEIKVTDIGKILLQQPKLRILYLLQSCDLTCKNKYFFLNPAFQFMMMTSCLLDTIMMKPYLCTVTICTFWLDILLYKSIPLEHRGILLAYGFALWDLPPSLTFTNKGDKS